MGNFLSFSSESVNHYKIYCLVGNFLSDSAFHQILVIHRKIIYFVCFYFWFSSRVLMDFRDSWRLEPWCCLTMTSTGPSSLTWHIYIFYPLASMATKSWREILTVSKVLVRVMFCKNGRSGGGVGWEVVSTKEVLFKRP